MNGGLDTRLPAGIIGLMGSGTVTVSEGGTPAVRVSAARGEVTVDIVSLPVPVPAASRVLATLSEAQGLARELGERGVTLTVCSSGRPVIRLGRLARPRLSRLVTRSGDVEVTDLRELRRLDRRLRAGPAQH